MEGLVLVESFSELREGMLVATNCQWGCGVHWILLEWLDRDALIHGPDRVAKHMDCWVGKALNGLILHSGKHGQEVGVVSKDTVAGRRAFRLPDEELTEHEETKERQPALVER